MWRPSLRVRRGHLDRRGARNRPRNFAWREAVEVHVDVETSEHDTVADERRAGRPHHGAGHVESLQQVLAVCPHTPQVSAANPTLVTEEQDGLSVTRPDDSSEQRHRRKPRRLRDGLERLVHTHNFDAAGRAAEVPVDPPLEEASRLSALGVGQL